MAENKPENTEKDVMPEIAEKYENTVFVGTVSDGAEHSESAEHSASTEHSDDAAAACTCRQCRMKSWAMWVSVLGLLGIILQHTGVFAKLGLDSETWDMIITLIGGVLTAFGIVNNPTEKKKL